jgi:hypothetical protein
MINYKTDLRQLISQLARGSAEEKGTYLGKIYRLFQGLGTGYYNSIKLYARASRFADLMSMTDDQLRRLNSNERCALLQDPSYGITDELKRRIWSRGMSESDYFASLRDSENLTIQDMIREERGRSPTTSDTKPDLDDYDIWYGRQK